MMMNKANQTEEEMIMKETRTQAEIDRDERILIDRALLAAAKREQQKRNIDFVRLFVYAETTRKEA